VDAGLFSVDVFFYVGGFLVAFVLLRNKPKTNAEYLIAILQRAMRLWPSYLVAIMIFYALYEHTGSGPIWGNDEPIIRRCEHFWQSIIFIDNLVDNGKSECLGWGWYLQNDMQLFVISMIIMLIYSKNKLIAKVTASILIIASLIFTFVYCQ
jgi:peptidoglycan/LPS O-acetylase OafA/YrhL